MKKNQITFIPCLIASLLNIFLIAHSICSKTLPPTHLQNTLKIPQETIKKINESRIGLLNRDFPQLIRQDTLKIIDDTVSKSQIPYHKELRATNQNQMSQNDTLRIIGDAVNKGIFYKESYAVQLKISEKLYNNFESLYRENRQCMRLLDSLSHTAQSKFNYLPTAIITTGIVSVIWSLVFILLK